MKTIAVFDNLLSNASLQSVQNHFAENVRWNYGWPQGTHDPFSHWNIDFLHASLRNQEDQEPKLFAQPELQPIADIWRALKAGPLKDHRLVRCYANAHTYGVEGYPHTDVMDVKEQPDNYTAVVYLNPVWKLEWGGELAMFDKSGDVFMSILPKPGRVAVIPGEYLHAARGVSRTCPAVRICVAFKSKRLSNEEKAAV